MSRVSTVTNDHGCPTKNGKSGKPFCMDSILGPRCKIYRFVIYKYICFISTAILEVYNNIIPDVNVQEIPLNSTPFRLAVFLAVVARCFDACLSPVKLQLLTKWFLLFPHTAKTLSPDIYDAWARLYMTLCLC